MTVRHIAVSFAAIACLAACDSGDTIIALNVTATDQVPAVRRLQVTLTQGSRTLTEEFEPPSETSAPAEGEEPKTSIKNAFFRRITLSEEWQEESAKLEVEAFDEDGEPFDPPLIDETMVRIERNDVVAAYVTLDIPQDPPPDAGGAGGAAGGQTAGGETSSGADSGGAASGGDTGNAGAAGQSASGGGAAGAG